MAAGSTVLRDHSPSITPSVSGSIAKVGELSTNGTAEQVRIKAGAGRRVLDIEQDETEIWHREDSWLNIAAEAALRHPA